MTAPRFLSPLDLRVVDDASGRPLYALLAPFGYRSRLVDGEIWVPAGYRTDLASIPAAAMALIGGQPGDRAAVVHDWLVDAAELERGLVDRVFLEALRVCGVEPAVAETMYLAVATYTAYLAAQDGPPTDWSANV